MNVDFETVLFDYDGTLADTCRENFAGWQYAFDSLGVKLNQREYYLLEGFKIKIIAEKLLRSASQDIGLADEIVGLREKYAREFHQPKLYPETLPLLKALRAEGVRCAMVTAASRARVQHPDLAELRANLDALICGEDCKIGKPDAEPYFLAAQALGCSARQCVVVENAPAGIASAKAAGMYCIAITSTLEKQDLTNADLIFNSLQSCSNLLLGKE